jgi:hypothetical protein
MYSGRGCGSNNKNDDTEKSLLRATTARSESALPGNTTATDIESTWLQELQQRYQEQWQKNVVSRFKAGSNWSTPLDSPPMFKPPQRRPHSHREKPTQGGRTVTTRARA